jgi:glucose-6-phosphate isomerase
MVVLPYKDRLLLFSRYLQQLVMESLGKALDMNKKKVEQGIAVYGNKGSTDQHAYVQQLRDGVNNFFVTFIEALEDGGRALEVEPGVTAGDYLRGFLLGTRQGLYENGRESLTISIRRVDARTIGVLIALFERAVGFYASLVNINAYHQPGVQAGKKAAVEVLKIQREVAACLSAAGRPLTADEVAQRIGKPKAVETVFKILEYLAANGRGVIREPGATIFDAGYRRG